MARPLFCCGSQTVFETSLRWFEDASLDHHKLPTPERHSLCPKGGTEWQQQRACGPTRSLHRRGRRGWCLWCGGGFREAELRLHAPQ
jgi:hypothetical protein